MTQSNQNKVCKVAYNLAMEDFKKSGYKYECKRLRSCSAWVYASDNWFLLKSYNTFVACINRNSGEAHDFLRYVYGYTATSAQHIAKFFNDYNAIPSLRYRYYPN